MKGVRNAREGPGEPLSYFFATSQPNQIKYQKHLNVRMFACAYEHVHVLVCIV